MRTHPGIQKFKYKTFHMKAINVEIRVVMWGGFGSQIILDCMKSNAWLKGLSVKDDKPSRRKAWQL